MFPIGRAGAEEPSADQTMLPSEGHDIESKVKLVMSQIQAQKVIPLEELGAESDGTVADQEKDKIPRPGSRYTCYRTQAELPDSARVFYETAANLAGISVDTLVKAAFKTELMIRQWQEDKRRTEYHDEAFDDAIYISGDEDDEMQHDDHSMGSNE